MHDLAISVAGSLITSFDVKGRNIEKKTRHVSFVGNDPHISSLCKASRIRTFLYFGGQGFGAKIDCDAIFSSFKLLRVLDMHLKNLDFVPSSIGKLKHLKYLDLSENGNIKKLPNSITKLQNLQTLKLSNCWNLEKFPRGIERLVNLRHLEIDGCRALTYMPRGLGQLTNLQTLSRFVVHTGSLSKHSGELKELNKLNKLAGELVIRDLRHEKDVASEYKAANLKEKQHLHSLHLWWNTQADVNDLNVNVDDEMLLEGFQPHPNLKQLSLVNYPGSRLSSWLLSLTNLVRFELWMCKKCQYLPPLSQLPSLKYLSLTMLDTLQYISNGGDSNEFSSSSSAPIPFFPSLKEIKIDLCPNLKGWWRRHSSEDINSDNDYSVQITAVTPMTEHHLFPSFPHLSTLQIWNCPMLTSMPMFPHLEGELVLWNASLKPLQQTMMMNMAALQSPTSIAIASSSSTPLSKLKYIKLNSITDLEILPEDLNSLESLTILNCNRIKSLSQGVQQFTALQYLHLCNCRELELANDEDGMQWQGLKSLISLEFTHLPKLVSLPLGLQHLTTLQKLEISNCENLTAIPEGIHNCTSLQVLEIGGCSSLTSLPEGMGRLTSLRRLKVEKCPILLQRCERETGEDWTKISHIPELDLRYPPQQKEKSNIHASSIA
ncbi:disease resistance protein RGA2-like [Corylus avellana]|uniref:disease resistance protein RGA2-like n=1 Tax=Corylus avellana TaxID=13451 RepID=UPI00286A7D53|nr:disease resistance protein RGA2-like [Corylus avellana]